MRPDDKMLHQQLDLILKYRSHCFKADVTPEVIQRLLRMSLLFARDIMTDEIFRQAMGKGEVGQGLHLLAHRVARLEPLLCDDWPDFGFDELKADLFAVAQGDQAQVILPVGTSGKKTNAHRLLKLKIEAHVWYKVLRLLGMKAALRQELVHGSFGVTSSAFTYWRREFKQKHPNEDFDHVVATLGVERVMAARATAVPMHWAVEQTKKSGKKYIREMRLTRLKRSSD